MIVNNKFQKYNPHFFGAINPTKISFPLKRQTDSIINILDEVTPNIHKLRKAKNNSKAKSILNKLKEITGIDTIFEEGLSFICDDKRVKILISDKKIKIREQSIKNRKNFLDIELNESEVKTVNGLTPKSGNIEDFLKNVYEKLDFPLLQLRIFLSRSDVTETLSKLSKPTQLNSNNIEVVNDIKILFSEITDLINSIKNYSTRSKIKNGYKFSEPTLKHSKQINLRTSSGLSEKFSVNTLTDKSGSRYFVIRTSSDNETWQNFIIDEQNRVLKERSIKSGRNDSFGNSTVYYSPKELDSSLFTLTLTTLKREMEKYKNYLGTEVEKLNTFNSKRVTNIPGTIDKKSLSLIENIKLMYDNCKRKMHKLPNAKSKEKFKQRYQIETKTSSPCLIFNNINSEKEGLHLSFPFFNKKPCIKIIVIKQNGNPGKCFLIQDNKLIKFETKDFGKGMHSDQLVKYHSQEEINNSGLQEYLLVLKERLSAIPMIGTKNNN